MWGVLSSHQRLQKGGRGGRILTSTSQSRSKVKFSKNLVTEGVKLMATSVLWQFTLISAVSQLHTHTFHENRYFL